MTTRGSAAAKSAVKKNAGKWASSMKSIASGRDNYTKPALREKSSNKSSRVTKAADQASGVPVKPNTGKRQIVRKSPVPGLAYPHPTETHPCTHIEVKTTLF